MTDDVLASWRHSARRPSYEAGGRRGYVEVDLVEVIPGPASLVPRGRVAAVRTTT